MPVSLDPTSLGAKLQLARQRRGVSLRQIADSTKISIDILEALESNDIVRVPIGVYGRGFVRSFAAEVGLDPETTLAEFDAQFPPDSKIPKYPTLEQLEKNRPFENRVNGLTLLGVTALAVPVIAFLLYSSGKGKKQELAPVQSRATIVNSQAARSNPSARSAAAAAPEPSPAAPASSASSLITAPEVAPPVAESPAGAQANAKSAGEEPVAERLAVVLSATRPSWVIATVDGNKVVNRLLEGGEQEMLDARHEVVLTLGDAGAIVMTLNGAEAKPLGRTSETVTIRVNRSNLKRYLALP